MTLDKLAAMTQREFRVIRRDSATKEGLEAIRYEGLKRGRSALGLHKETGEKLEDRGRRLKRLEHAKR